MFVFRFSNPLGASEEGREGRTREKENGVREKLKNKRRQQRKINGALTRVEEDKGKRAKREKETSCHYLGWISSAQGFLTAEQREREGEKRMGGVRGKGGKTRNEQVAGGGPGGGTPKESHSLGGGAAAAAAAYCCLLLLGGKRKKGKGKGTPAKTARREKSRQHRDRLVGSGLVWSFFPCSSANPHPKGREKREGKKIKKIDGDGLNALCCTALDRSCGKCDGEKATRE
ncbi:hypothetical protein M747DRAFT_78998 [Aspergillus niger ATCC 13496]|uniref:Uncharacterized protein n=1 Tax=Aspergillus niger ATCC 13496 TaxID=1353008 RepID=A0A370BXP3_ASPNG|nr:hypothetical protein M747DRAFT_78998 [Aspergillus niger ATCC 13496]